MNKRSLIFASRILLFLLIAVALTIVFFPKNKGKNVLTNIDPRRYGRACEIVERCNDIVAVSCKPEVDGPFLYVDEKTGAVVAECGGVCEIGNCPPDSCPPKAWVCN